MFAAPLIAKAKELLKNCGQYNLTIITAESCTGGLLSALLTEVPGSSTVFERGFVTYSNTAKETELGVPEALIAKHGAVSAEVAGAMVQGALAKTGTGIAVSITGVAGPGGGSAEKPVGLVYIAVARTGRKPVVKQHQFSGDRSAVRMAAVDTALEIMDVVIKDK